MKRKMTAFLSLLLVISMLLGACAQHMGGAVISTQGNIANDFVSDAADEENANVQQMTASNKNEVAPAKGTYNEGVVLVKVEETFNAADLGELAYVSAEPLYAGSKWYAVELAEGGKAEDAVAYLSQQGAFANVDYDYVMGANGPKEDAQDNPNYDNQVNLGLSNIPNGWTHNGKAPGGSPDVVVAVIDTGVDYNHLDLRNNIWINTAEIPDNGKDDDGNGYVDDVYGWNFVGNNKNPMDDNGHGTHVAGIIAAENNKEGGIGVAYNCKVMVLKAGNSSGYFNNSDIAKAIQYAYMNGASVINMSFGGSNISIAVEEALENAYNACVLVAAAGNDGACNNLACRTCDNVGVSYPAALPYVIGVMSVDKDGKHSSTFSNYDHNPYDSVEYEVYAVGEGVGSTWPSNKYACLNGTSMAAPTVAGIAALLRSYYSDREVYSTKFIQSQIVNTGTVYPHMSLVGDGHVTDEAHSVADVQEAMTKLPKPAVNLYDYYIDDSTAISPNNNGNGVMDAGETVRLYISLHNRGGVATNVNVSIDTYRSEIGNEALTDPYFTFVNPTMQLSDIGTYSVRESGDKYFEIVVDEACPNDYPADFNIRFTYTNGMDEKDKTVYEDDGKQKAQFNVSKGYLLPATIDKDTVFKADKLYIVGHDVVIPAGVTVTFEEGCEIQFYDDREYYSYPRIENHGTLNFNGTQENTVYIHPDDRHADFICVIYSVEGEINLNHTQTVNLRLTSSKSVVNVKNSKLINQEEQLRTYKNGAATSAFNEYLVYGCSDYDSTVLYENSYIELNSYYQAISASEGGCMTWRGNYVKISQKNGNSIKVDYMYDNFIEFYTPARTSSYDTTFRPRKQLVNNVLYAKDISSLVSIELGSRCVVSDNLFSELHRKYATQAIQNYYDSTGNPIVDVYSSLSNASLLWPYVVSVEMFDASGNPITRVGKEEIKVRVTFNRPMDISKNTFLTFGTIEPYADYRIDGTWVSDTVWEGNYALKAQIENGQNFLKVNNACAAEDQTKTVFGEYQLHEFTIDTTAAMSMNLMAFPQDDGILLQFAQDDYDTLLGYNIYRSTDKDGNYVKMNPTVLLPEETTFLDDNAEPGKTYWYTYTVVLSDFTESRPAGIVQATAKDTMVPSLYHTPVNQGYENNNLVISCTASDNVGIEKVTLYYRAVGETQWKSLVMSKQNDKFNATIFGSDVTMAGLEYYIVAADAYNTVNKGSAEAPYTVVVKSADTLTRMGDVDGDGAITAKDALMLMKHINKELVLSDDEFKRADLDGNGKLSSGEALCILQYINGKITELKMPQA